MTCTCLYATSYYILYTIYKIRVFSPLIMCIKLVLYGGTVHIYMYYVVYTLYSVQCTLYSVHCTGYNIQCTLCNVQNAHHVI